VGEEGIHVAGNTFVGRATLIAKLKADIASTKSFQADMTAWDPERNQPILVEVKQYKSSKARFSLAHELGFLELSGDDTRRTNAVAQDGPAEQLAYDRLLAERLAREMGKSVIVYPASYATSASEESWGGVRSGEPVWVSRTRCRFEPRLRRPPGQITVEVPTVQVWTIGQDRAALIQAAARVNRRSFEAIRCSLSVTFGTTQLARDYRTAQLRLASSILAARRLMLARLVSAFVRQSKAPAFLLVMLASARHYGHRSESADHLLPTSVLKPPLLKGAACLVT
jgi:hypothetical protein